MKGRGANRGKGNRSWEGEHKDKSLRPASLAILVARVCWLFLFIESLYLTVVFGPLKKKEVYEYE